MKFQISREALLKPLQIVAGAVERRQTLPVLSNILLQTKGQILSLLGTDLEVELIARLPLSAPADPAEITIPARKIMDICRTLPDDARLTFTLKEKNMVVQAGRGRYTLSTLPADDFPRLEESSPSDLEFSLDQEALAELIQKTSFSMAQQDVRYYLNGLYLDISPTQIRAVATDGHRLATSTLEAKLPEGTRATLIIPRKAVLELSRLLSEDKDALGITVGDKFLRLVTVKYSFSTKLIEGKFPDYKQVLPKQAGSEAIIDKAAFKQMLSRVSVLFTDKNRGAWFTLSEGSLQIRAKNNELDEVEESLPISYSGEEIRVGLNISYILEYLNIARADNVKMTVSDPNASVLFEDAEHADTDLYVVMPMRL